MSEKGNSSINDANANSSTKIKPSSTTIEKKQNDVPVLEKSIVDKLISEYGDRIKVSFIKPLRMKVEVDRSDIIEIATFIKEVLLFDHAESVAGTDYPKGNYIEVVYHLGSYSRDELAAHVLSLATRTSRENSSLPSLVNIYKSVEYHERETFEMLGVYFEGHPRNDRFLLPEDWADIPPMRKEFRIKGR